ncbi:hypothetical protein FCV38_11940 [Clostridium sporogenes]|nr:hypothetical protein [Clostridium sporogenes]
MKKEIKVIFLSEDIGNSRQIFKEFNTQNYYCRIEGNGWYTIYNPHFEPSESVKATFIICDIDGNKITDDNKYPFINKFIQENTKEYIKNYHDFYTWKKYILKDKERFSYTDYNDNWLYFEIKQIRQKVENTLNYLGKEIQIKRIVYEHKISGKRWTQFTAELNGENLKILGYYF